MSARRLGRRPSLDQMVARVDSQPRGEPSGDTVPTGFPSIDKILGGGFRRRDLIVLGGDVGSGKSALALGIALRVARAGLPVAFVSGEMDEERLLERALALEGRVTVDDLRSAKLTDQSRAGIGAAAVRLRDLPLRVHPLAGETLEQVARQVERDAALVMIDYLQLLPGAGRATQDEDLAVHLRELKALALARQVVCLAVTQLPRFDPRRPDHRPTLDDYGHLGAVKQHADVVLSLYREEMYDPGRGVEGATELLVGKNRNGPTGFVDLYFYRRWMRFEDILDPEP